MRGSDCAECRERDQQHCEKARGRQKKEGEVKICDHCHVLKGWREYFMEHFDVDSDSDEVEEEDSDSEEVEEGEQKKETFPKNWMRLNQCIPCVLQYYPEKYHDGNKMFAITTYKLDDEVLDVICAQNENNAKKD